MSWEAGITKESIDGSNSTSRCCFRSLSLSLVRLLARRLVAASAHRSLLVALELLGLSRLCLSFVCFVSSATSSLLTGGFGGLGDIGEHLLSLRSLSIGRLMADELLLLIEMLESSSRLAPSNQAMPMVSSTFQLAWRSTIIEVSCWSSSITTIECKYSLVTMARSSPSSARKASNQASSCILMALRSITIMIASSSLIKPIIEYNHGL